jgi:hypothetical protein
MRVLFTSSLSTIEDDISEQFIYAYVDQSIHFNGKGKLVSVHGSMNKREGKSAA